MYVISVPQRQRIGYAQPKDELDLYQQLHQFDNAFRNSGVQSENTREYMLAQDLLESNDHTSHNATVNNNYSGIRPNKSGFGFDAGNGFAGYKHPTYWIKDYMRVLSMGAKPIEALTANEFLNRLEKNNYFHEPNGDRVKERAQYSANFNAKLKKVRALKAKYKGQEFTITPTPPSVYIKEAEENAKAYFSNLLPTFSELSMPIKVGAGIAAIFLIKEIFKK